MKHRLLPALFLITALLIGFAARFILLDKIPISLNWDEASLGYNAYSLSETGQDEYGRSWPLIIESFGDYKTGLYSWLLGPFIQAWGLIPFTIRFPNMLAGVLVILASFYLAKKLLENSVSAGIVAVLTAISPWAIHASRFALEWHLGFPLAILAFGLVWNKKHFHIFLPLSAVLLSLSFYFYHLFRGWIILLLALGYLILNHKILKTKYKSVLLSILIGVLVFLPFYQSLRSTDWLSRPGSVAVFGDQKVQDTFTEGMYRHVSSKLPLTRVFNNKLVFYGKEILDRYLTHFSPQFLILGEDASPRTEVEKVGKIHLISLPFLIIGIVQILKRKQKSQLFLLWWLLIAPLPSSLTTEAPHAQRSLLMLPAITIITVIGINRAYQYFKTKKPIYIPIFVTFTILGYLAGFSYFAWRYFLFYPEDTANSWQAGHQAMIEEVNQHQDQFDHIIVTTQYGQPHIFFAFYTPIDPQWYQQQVSQSDQQGIFNARIPRLGKLEFRQIQTTDFCLENTLVVASPGQLPKELPRLENITSPHRFRQEKPVVFEMFDTNEPKLQAFCNQLTSND